MENASETGYEASSIVKACVDKIAVPLRSVPWRVSKFMEDPEEKQRFFWEMKGVPLDQKSEFIKDYHRGRGWNKKSHLQPLNEHPLEQLIMQPNKWYSGPEYVEMSAQHLLLGGNALFHQVRNSTFGGGRTIELWLIPPDEIEPQRDRNRWIAEYLLNDKGAARPRSIKAEDIIHMKLPNPRDPFWGISPLKSAATSVDTDIEAVSWNKVSLQNRAITSGVFTFDKPMTRERWEEARQQVAEQHQGADNVYAPWVLGAGAKWQQLSLTPVEMDFIKSRSMTRDDVAMVFGEDPRIFGAGEVTANREAIREIWRLHWLNLLLPFLDRYEEPYNKYLVPEYPGEDLFVWYDTSNVDALRESDLDKRRMAKIDWSMGIPINMINERLRMGYPPIPGGDIGFLPASAVTVDRAILGDTKPAGSETNLDTAPDGGDNVTDNVIPPGDEPDATGVTAEVGNEGMKNLPESGIYSNGHAKRWTLDEVEDDLLSGLVLDEYDIKDDGNFFLVKTNEPDADPDAPFHMRYYHGGRDLMLASKRRDWGWHD
jgi:HK97 family phage portal protein